MSGILDALFTHILLILIVLPAIGALITALIMKKSDKIAEYFAMLIVTVEMILTIILALKFDFEETGFQFEQTYEWLPGAKINLHVGVDGISMVMLLLTGFICFIAAWTSFHQIRREDNRALYFAVFLLFEVGIIGTFISLNLIAFYLFWELVLPSMFLLIGKWGPHPEQARHAAIKFFIFTFAGSVIMLAGFVYLFMATGTFDMIVLAQYKISPEIQAVAFGLIFFGLAVKLPLVPFHTWLPDAHVEAPAPVSVLLAGLLLKMGGYGFVRMVWLLPEGFTYKAANISLFHIFLVIAVGGAIYSGLVAMGQDNFKRMVAYTSINHMSYVFFATLVAAWARVNGGDPELAKITLAGGIFEMFAHGIAIGLMFLMAGVLLHKMGTYHISELGGLGKVTPRISVLLLFGSLAVFGFPPLVVFVGEIQIFVGGLGILFEANMYLPAIILVAPLIIVSAYLWTIRRVVMSETTPMAEKGRDLDWNEIIPLAILCAAIILFGVWPSLITNYMSKALEVQLGLL